jgi:putative transposase
MRDHKRAELTISAVIMAIQRQKPPPGLIHHSDRGSQYAAADYRKVLGAAGVIQAKPCAGREIAQDNAPMERCFGNLKTELVHQACDPTREGARPDLFASIDGYSNRQRFIPPLGISPPNRPSAKPPNPGSAKSPEGHRIRPHVLGRPSCI